MAITGDSSLLAGAVTLLAGAVTLLAGAVTLPSRLIVGRLPTPRVAAVLRPDSSISLIVVLPFPFSTRLRAGRCVPSTYLSRNLSHPVRVANAVDR